MERISTIMQKYELDALIASTTENVAYTSGYLSPPRFNYTTQFYVVVPREEDQGTCLIIPTVKLATAAQMPLQVKEIESYGAFYIEKPSENVALEEASQRLSAMLLMVKPKSNALEALEEVLCAKGLTKGRLGIDEMGFDPSVLARFQSDFPEAELVQAYQIFREAQAIKTDEECQIIKKACKITMAAINEALEMAGEGMAQRELVERYESKLIKQGAAPAHSNIRCGQSAAFPDVLPSDYRLAKGDLVSWDVGCIYQGYHSDLAGTAVVGKPNAKQLRYYEAVLEGEKRALETVKPGARVADTFHAAVETVRAKGIPHYNRNGCGHGIGIEAYGLPLVVPESPHCFEVGMVLNVETPYYELGFGGVIVEDTIRVTDSGFEYLSTIDRDLHIL